MKHWFSMSVGILFAVAVAPHAKALTQRGAVETVYLHSKEISLPDFQLRQLKADLPSSDALFDAIGNLWILGRSSIWKWTLGEQTLQRVKLTTDNDPLITMTMSNGYLFAASNLHLYRIRFGPDEITKFPHPANENGESARLVAGTRTVWWIHTKGVTWLDEHNALQTLPRTTSSAPLTRNASWFDHDNRQLWMIDGTTLSQIDFRHTPPKSEDVHRASHPFVGIHGDGQHLMVHTNHTIIRFDAANLIKQIIPVEGSRKLIASDINANVHTYLFNDKLLEIYDVEKEIRYQSRINITITRGATKLLTHGHHTLVISDGEPHLFSHEHNLNISQHQSEKRTDKI